MPSLASDLEISVEEAQETYDKFMETKPSVNEFIERTHENVYEYGYVETMQGHRRNLKDIWGDKQKQSGALRQSVNTINY